jgi:hypothetical protein
MEFSEFHEALVQRADVRAQFKRTIADLGSARDDLADAAGGISPSPFTGEIKQDVLHVAKVAIESARHVGSKLRHNQEQYQALAVELEKAKTRRVMMMIISGVVGMVAIFVALYLYFSR